MYRSEGCWISSLRIVSIRRQPDLIAGSTLRRHITAAVADTCSVRLSIYPFVNKSPSDPLFSSCPSRIVHDEDEEDEAATNPSLLGMSETQLKKITVVELKGMCRNRGLPVGGRKADLIQRLLVDG